MPKAAEPPSSRFNAGESLARRAEQLDRDDLICLVRQIFSSGPARDRDTAIGELAQALGYQRTGSRIGEELDNAIRTAVRRGILEHDGSSIRLAARSIEDYERPFLKDQFLASLAGRQWIERDGAARGFARWMGFRRTGASIEEMVQSLINGLIREERLESEGSRIRRVG